MTVEPRRKRPEDLRNGPETLRNGLETLRNGPETMHKCGNHQCFDFEPLVQ